MTYVDDSLAKVLVDAMASDTDPSNDYTPNPTWFTLPEGGGGGGSTPTDSPVPSPTLAPVDAPPSPQPQCGLNKATCQARQDCCSGNCKNNQCKGNGRFRRLSGLPRNGNGGPPVWANPIAQQRWNELIYEQGLDDAKVAIHTINVEKCGGPNNNNPIQVTQEWIDQTGIDTKYFRCYVE